MRTVGQILKEEREKKFYTLEEIEKATKIRKEFLEALEAGQYQKLPPPTFTGGFIKNYGKFLGLPTEKLLAIFRREFSERANPPKILESFKNPIDQKKFRITPGRILVTVISALVVIFFAYLWFEFRFLVGAPLLEVEQPPDQFNTTLSEVVVSGRTDLENKVSINEQEIAVDQKGRFSQPIKLQGDINNITISATNKNGKRTEVTRTVFLKR